MRRLHPAWVGLLGALLYAPTLAYGFVSYDDPWLIRDNRLLHELSVSSVWTVFTDFSWERRYRLGAEYLPVRDFSVMIDYALYGDWIGGHHLTQVLLYGLLCATVAIFVWKLFESRPLAWVASLLFATHPVHVEAVCWLSERKGVLGTLMLFASFVCAVRYLRRGGGLVLVASWLLFLLSVWSKGVNIAGAGAIVLIALVVDSVFKRRATLVGGYAVVGAAAFVPLYLTGRAMKMVQAHAGSGPIDALLIFFQAHGKYLGLMTYGGPYAIQYPLRPDVLSLGWWLCGAVACGVGLAACVWALLTKRWRSAAVFGVLWWLVFLAPVSQLVFPLQNYLADRYLFVPSFGLSLAAGALLLRLPQRPSLALIAICVLVGVAWTFAQTATWASSEALYEQAVYVDPHNADAWDKLANEAAQRKDFDRAWQLAAQGLEHSPDYWRLLHRQALILEATGRLRDATVLMRRAASGPEAHRAHANLALLLLRQGKKEEALEQAQRAVSYQSQTAHNHRTLGIVAVELDDRGLACTAFKRAHELEPDNPQNQQNLRFCQ